MMDLTQLANLGEFIGGVAVLVTLVYLAAQVRQSNSIERARANREMQRGVNEVYIGGVDSEIQALYSRALVDFDSISDHEKALLHHRFLIPMGVHCTSTFLAAKDGLIDEVWAEGWTRYWVMMISSPGLSTWWRDLRPYFQPEFTAEVSRVEANGSHPALIDALPWLAGTRGPKEG